MTTGTAAVAAEPEHDWHAAAAILYPVLRPAGAGGTRLDELDPGALAAEGMKTHARPLLDDGPAGLAVGYVLRNPSFDVLVNADHLLAWAVTPEVVRATARANLARWSLEAPWSDEASGHRRLVSSATGDGSDAARILLDDTRRLLAAMLGSDAPGPRRRVLVGLPERDLLVAATLRDDDVEFVALFAEFVRAQAADVDEPLDLRVLELVDGELRPFAG